MIFLIIRLQEHVHHFFSFIRSRPYGAPMAIWQQAVAKLQPAHFQHLLFWQQAVAKSQVQHMQGKNPAYI